ncbi:hypothetical protein WJX81_006009 [Elliptochloris bilobata]|uniref:Uncharacterized protein n=1 Tax=Elliptochloris bilobata TaxID=381761 RepID=A0AAW1QDU0_9CHLO
MQAPLGDLPRALEVQQFAEAREAEIEVLCNALKASGTWGAATLPRHLRRRATSHNSYKHRRRPNLQLLAKRQRTQEQDTEQASAVQDGVAMDRGPSMPEPQNRAMRRRPGRLQRSLEAALAGEGPNVAEEGRMSVESVADKAATRKTSSPLQHLETHVWHAKRFAMASRWGHMLAEGLPGRGRGSRAVMAELRGGALLHDASYWQAVQLAGPVAGLRATLVTLCDAGVLGHCRGASSAYGVQIVPRSADLRRVELAGSGSDRIIAALLGQGALLEASSAVSQVSEQLWTLVRDTGGAVSEALPGGFALALRLRDPPLPTFDKEVAEMRRLCGKLRHERLPASPLWAQARPPPPPLPEAAVSMMRRCERLAAMHLSGLAPTPDPALAEWAATETPLVAVRHAPVDAVAAPTWALLLPAHWVPPVWHALVFAGARPAGLREWRGASHGSLPLWSLLWQ